MWLAPEPVPITMTQLESLMTAALIFDRAGVNGNARPAQPFNDRVIFPTLEGLLFCGVCEGLIRERIEGIVYPFITPQ
jgi:hypothetical protein